MKFKLTLLSIIVLLTIACDDDKFIGGNLRPAQDEINISFVDTIGFKAFSYSPGVLRTDLGVSGNNYFLLGGFQPQDIDEATSVKGDIVLEFWTDTFKIPSEGTVKDPADSTGATLLAGDLVIDTIFLRLIHAGQFGDTLATNFFEVYELNTRLTHTQDYFENENPLDYYSPSDKIGEYSAQSKYDEDTLAFRFVDIPLDMEVAERLANNQDKVTSTEGFRDLFKGVYIKTLSGEGALWRIYPEYNFMYTSLVVQYHYEANTSDRGVLIDSIIYTETAIVNNESAGFNVYRKTPGTYDFTIDGNSMVQPESLYLQGLGIANIRIKLPSIYDHPEFAPMPGEDSSKIAINSAKLVFQLDSVKQEQSLEWSPSVIAIRRDTTGGLTYTPGQLLYINNNTNDNYIYGIRKSDFTYEFNIAEYLQELFNLRTEKPDDLVLSISNNRNNPSAAFLNGLGGNESPKLEIIYTRY